MRFRLLEPAERERAEKLLAEFLARPKHANVEIPSRQFVSLCGAVGRAIRHGPPPNRFQRLAYRSHKRRRAKAEAARLYGDPKA